MSKPIAIFMTDSHKKPENLDMVYDIFLQAIKLAKEYKCKYVIHGGDFFNDRIGQNLANLLKFQEILEEFEDNEIMLLAIPGNHDKTNQESPKSYLSIFKSKYFKLFSKESVYTIDKNEIHFLPFFSKSMEIRLDNLVSKVQNDNTLLVTHAAFNSVRNNDGSKVKDGLKKKSVKVYKKVIVGHYHDSSKIGQNIFYTGSCYQGNFGENPNDKGFHIIYDNLDLEFVPAIFKKYVKVKLSIDSDIDTQIESVENLDANVRFVFQGKKSDFSKVDTKKLDELGIDYKFEWEDINEEILKVEAGEFGTLDKKAVLKYFLEYCKIQKIESDKRKFGLKIISA